MQLCARLLLVVLAVVLAIADRDRSSSMGRDVGERCSNKRVKRPGERFVRFGLRAGECIEALLLGTLGFVRQKARSASAVVVGLGVLGVALLLIGDRERPIDRVRPVR